MKTKKIPAYIKKALNEFNEKLSGYKPETQYNYMQSVKHFLSWYGSRPKKTDNMKKSLQKYKSHLTQKKYSPSTINLYVSSVIRFYNVVLNQFDEVKPVKTYRNRTNVETLTKAQINKLLEGTTNKKHLIAFRLAFGNGCNVGEIVGIKVEQIMKAPYREIELPRRKIIVDDITFQLISDLIPGKGINDYLFTNSSGNKINVRSMQKALESHCKNLEIPIKGGFQTLRHTYVKNLMDNGTSIETIRQLLNHSNIKTTRMLYGCFENKKKKNVPDLSPLNNETKIAAQIVFTVFANGKTDFRKREEKYYDKP